jgi:hypothetical protein
MFGYPFSGDLRVCPDRFHVALAVRKIEAPSSSH